MRGTNGFCGALVKRSGQLERQRSCWHCLLLLFFGCFTLLSKAAETDAARLVERGSYYRTWENVTAVLRLGGELMLKTNRYTELGDGLCYFRDGQWHDSEEVIDIVPGGALASRGPHQVGFAANINTRGAIDFVSPEGRRLHSHVLGLAYTDVASGKSVLIAGIKDSTGQLVAPNQIVYPDAFENDNAVWADLRYTYKKGSFEQDVILRAVPPDPALFGLDPATTRLEVFTEFIGAPEPTVTEIRTLETALPAQRAGVALPEFVDQSLGFGDAYMSAGQPFPLGEEPADFIPTGKTWERREGRTFLIEAVQYSVIKPYVEILEAKKVLKQANAAGRAGRSFPSSPRQARNSVETVRTASLSTKQIGFVIDYTLATGAKTNFTFKGDTTYLLTSTLTLWGSNNVLEGGAVIKQTNSGPQLRIHQGLDCRTTPYRPAIITSMHDDTVGDTIAGSTGNPTGYCGYMLWLGNSAGGYFNIHDVHISHGTRAIYGTAQVNADISNVQITHSVYGLRNNTAVWNYRNVLVRDVVYGFDGVTPLTNNAEHITFYSVSNFQVSGLPAVNLTNSLLISVTNNVSYTGASVATNLNSAGIFQTVGSGACYLATNSPYRDSGTTNINPSLLADLGKRTTYPPLLLTNFISSAQTLSPAIERDTNAPDLGFHYDAIDYLIHDLVISNATVSLSNGVCLAAVSNASWGIRLTSGARLLSDGTPLSPNRLFKAANVQEQRGTNNSSYAVIQTGTVDTTNRFVFTDFPFLSSDGFIFNYGTCGEFLFRHSWVRGGGMYSSGASLSFLATNVLFDRTILSFDFQNSPLRLRICNSLLYGNSSVYLGANGNSIGVDVYDTLFYSVTNLYFNAEVPIGHGHNGYYDTVQPSGSSGADVTLTNLAFQTGPLGSFYLPADCTLTNAGSTSATNRGLYHFTTTTNQVPETNSIVDIGLHYAALNAQGQPLDSDEDGTPNYVEDGNGNGAIDAGETPFSSLSVSITSPTNNAIFTWPVSMTIAGSVSAAGAAVTSVEFFANANSLGSDASAPYTLDWNNVAAGIYNLKAIVTDSSGWKATSAVITVYVNVVHT